MRASLLAENYINTGKRIAVIAFSGFFIIDFVYIIYEARHHRWLKVVGLALTAAPLGDPPGSFRAAALVPW